MFWMLLRQSNESFEGIGCSTLFELLMFQLAVAPPINKGIFSALTALRIDSANSCPSPVGALPQLDVCRTGVLSLAQSRPRQSVLFKSKLVTIAWCPRWGGSNAAPNKVIRIQYTKRAYYFFDFADFLVVFLLEGFFGFCSWFLDYWLFAVVFSGADWLLASPSAPPALLGAHPTLLGDRVTLFWRRPTSPSTIRVATTAKEGLPPIWIYG